MYTTFALLGLLSVVSAQMPDNNTEVHPKLTTYKCTTEGGCVPQNSAIVLNHGIYQRDHPELSCGDWGSAPNATVCPDQETCQKNCAIWSVSNYADHGVYTDGSDLQIVMIREDGQVNSPRLYLLNEAEDEYEMLKLTGQELSFDVDMSKLPCGMNAALYTVEMDATGGKNLSTIPTAGAAYGNGYCDAQCYTTPFSNGLVSFPPPVGMLCGLTHLTTPVSRPTSTDLESAATSWTSGRPTLAPPSLRRTPATRPECTSATAPPGSATPTACATRAAAARTPTRWGTRSTTARRWSSTPRAPSK